MGWSSGSLLASDLWDKIRESIPQENRKKVALALYDAVCDYDADDWDGESQLEIDADVNQEEEDYDWLDDEEDWEEDE